MGMLLSLTRKLGLIYTINFKLMICPIIKYKKGDCVDNENSIKTDTIPIGIGNTN